MDELKKCARNGCDVEFHTTQHNQIYHSDECCKLATNQRNIARYHERMAAKKGAKRVCKTPTCNSFLSRYNESKICAACERRAEDERNKRTRELIGI